MKIQQEQPYKRMQSDKVPATREVEKGHESPVRADTVEKLDNLNGRNPR